MVGETMGEVAGMGWVRSMVMGREGLMSIGMDICAHGGYALTRGHIFLHKRMGLVDP